MIVPGAPEEYKNLFKDESWSIWCHKEISDFEMSSFGATAGFFTEGTELRLIESKRHYFSDGPMNGQLRNMFLVSGISEYGQEITGWILASEVIQ
jgi:hypothetical protein